MYLLARDEVLGFWEDIFIGTICLGISDPSAKALVHEGSFLYVKETQVLLLHRAIPSNTCPTFTASVLKLSSQ